MIRLSVIVPLADHRGHALEAIDSWRQQTLDRAEYQLVVIIDGREPELERAIAPLLAPHDLLVMLPGGLLHDCYNAGAKAATGETLLFTESHVKAEPECLAQTLARLDIGDLDLIALASGGIDETRFAAQEQTIYEESLAERIEGGWNLCTVRGFALSRAAFERSGGYEGRYEHMSELALGAKLREQGVRMGYAPLARVWHFNGGTVETFARDLVQFGACEIRLRADQPDGPLAAALGPCPMWEERARLCTPAAWESVLSALGRAGVAALRFDLKQVGKSLEEAVRFLPFTLFGPAWLEVKAAAGLHASVVLLYLCYFSDGWYYTAFRTFWNACIRRGRAQAIVEVLRAEQKEPDAVAIDRPATQAS